MRFLRESLGPAMLSMHHGHHPEIEIIDNIFGLNINNRFWSSYDDAIHNSEGIAYKLNNDFVSTCYAAVISDNKAEIDVYTNPNYRKQGFAKKVTEYFLIQCLDKNIEPVWDCYSNNIASVNLAISLGFEKEYSYPFIIINTQK